MGLNIYDMILDNLYHSGVAHDENPPGRGSGRYGYGTGENPFQHQFTFRSEVLRLKKKGMTELQIAQMLIGPDANSNDLRIRVTREKQEERKFNRERALDLLDKNDGNVAKAAKELGIPRTTFQNYLKDGIDDRINRYDNIAEVIKKRCDEVKALDIGRNSELYMGDGISQTTKKVAIKMLQDQGYKIVKKRTAQDGSSGTSTEIMCLVPPDYDYKTAMKNNEFHVSSMVDFTPDNGRTWWTPEYPKSIDRSRILVRYNEEGGALKDGVIELRKNVEDISLGSSHYAQVRIAVDNKQYMKGMAIYGDDKDFPPGIDVIYNSNKPVGAPDSKVFKHMKMQQETKVEKMKADGMSYDEIAEKLLGKGKTEIDLIDKDNPFGAAIKKEVGQRHYTDENGKDQLSLINKIQEEGDWDNWGRTLSSQFLSKQSTKLIKEQLDKTIDKKQREYDEIMSLTNPIIKQRMLNDFAEKCDSNAADLSASGIKNQAFQVLLPCDIPDTEIYAPRFKNGDTVAVIRYPHSGPAEIPVLKVNNNNPKAKKMYGDMKDGVAINPKTAEQLSGADFDGDTGLIIPIDSNKISIIHKPYYKELIGWDNKGPYKLPDSAPPVKNKNKQREMGVVTNLITDMTEQGAPESDIVRAVKHSMVVIDSEKHHLDMKLSARENGIDELKKTYQGHYDINGNWKDGGASTIFSRAKAEHREIRKKEVTDRNKMTPDEQKRFDAGYKIYHTDPNAYYPERKPITDTSIMTPEELKIFNAGKKVYRETGKTKYRMTKVHQMDAVDDAMKLVRDKNDPKEIMYANFANDLKDFGRKARIESRKIKAEPVDPVAKTTYKEEIASLNRKIRIAQLNDPKERAARALRDEIVREKLKSNPDMDNEHKQRLNGLALQQARAQLGSGREKLVITSREWEAIQAHAITTNKLREVVRYADNDELKALAMPRNKYKPKLSAADIAKIKAMAANPVYTRSDIANAFGISASYVSELV